MRSIGNDIIALQLINPERTKQERFYSKILCKEEAELYNCTNFNRLPFENFVWLAWSVKESVYKLYTRNNPGTPFPPTKIIIRNIHLPGEQSVLNFCKEQEDISFNSRACYCCKVSFDSIIFYTRSLVYEEMILTVAHNTNCFDNVHWGIKYINDNVYAKQFQEVRTFALSRLSKIFLSDNLSIEKTTAGYPILTPQKNVPLSFTHHGNLVAYSFCVNAPDY